MMKTFKAGAFVYKNLFFLLFVALLMVVYIYNGHTAERKMRKIQSLKMERKEAKMRFMQIKQGNVYEGTESQLRKLMKDSDLDINKKVSFVIEGP